MHKPKLYNYTPREVYLDIQEHLNVQYNYTLREVYLDIGDLNVQSNERIFIEY